MNLLGIFIGYPYLAFVVALIFAVVFFQKRVSTVRTTAVLWFLYALWETSIKMRLTCWGECNIRIDLLLIYPILLIFTIVSIVKVLKKRTDSVV